MAETLILHHYDASPFSEKVRKIFGMKRLKWRAVEQPSIMPKPDLVPLTGGYRRIPVLQIGADVYCDTQLIVRLLERLHPAPTLYPGGSEGTCHAWNLWADRLLFLPLVAAVFAETWQFLPPEFIADRTKMVPGRNFGEMPKLGPPAREQVRALFAIVEAQLADGRPYLLGAEPSLADATCFQQAWFLRVAPQANALVEEFRHVSAWGARDRQGEPADGGARRRPARAERPRAGRRGVGRAGRLRSRSGRGRARVLDGARDRGPAARCRAGRDRGALPALRVPGDARGVTSEPGEQGIGRNVFAATQPIRDEEHGRHEHRDEVVTQAQDRSLALKIH